LFHNWREFASRKAHSSDLAVLPVFKEPRPFSLPAGRGRKNTKSIDSMQMFLRFLPGHTLWQHPLRGRENTQPPPIDANGF
jgi:hypothetical protein